MNHQLHYLHLCPPNSPPSNGLEHPFVAVVIVDIDVSVDWRHEVSEWLVEEGCLYMLAWGNDCSLWDDSVDWANLEAHNYENIPYDKFIITGWHEDEALGFVLWFAVSSAIHPTVPLDHLLILDITTKPREDQMRKLFFDCHCDM